MSNLYQVDFKVINTAGRFKVLVKTNESTGWQHFSTESNFDKAMESINDYKSWIKQYFLPKQEEVVYEENYTLPI